MGSNTSAVAGIIILCLWLAAAVGWIWNIVKIIGAIADPLTAMFVLRCIGIFFAPLGAVLGFC